MYEIPVKIYNLSNKTKNISIKRPSGLFKVDTDKKNKKSQISPGMHLEVIVIFETEKELTEDQFDEIVISSENNFKLILPLKAYLPQPLVQYEPLINLGFVPVGTKKMDVIQFLNDGALATRIDLKMETKNTELHLDKESITLPAYNAKIPEEKRKQIVSIFFEPTETQNLHEKIILEQTTGDKVKELGYIEVIATSVVQQMSIVFEEGGGPQTDINFGLLYHGQKKECSAFLVNNGPKEMNFKFFFHPNKSRRDFNGNYDTDDFSSTPEEAGLEMTQRILSAEPVSGFVKPYSQIPIKFLCKTKIKKQEKGWKVTLSPEYDINNKDKAKNLRDQLNKTEHFQSLAAVKFEEAFVNKLTAKDVEEDFCKTITVYMEVKALFPDITIDKTSLNFWECNVKEKKVIQIVITNKNDDLPIDFNFGKIPHFTVEPSKGIIKPSLGQNLSSVTVNVYFHPENIGKFADILVMKYVNNMYEIPIRIFGICKGVKKFTKQLKIMESMNKRYNEGVAKGINLTEAQQVPDELALDFTRKPFYKIDPKERIKRFHKNLLKEITSKYTNFTETKNSQETGFNPSNEIIKGFEDNFRVYQDIYNNKSLANAELVKMRKRRNNKHTVHIEIDEKNINNDALEQLVSLKGNRLESPKLKLPEPKDNLWVVKPIGQYEPVYMEENIKKSIGKTPDDMPDENISTNKKEKENRTGEVPRTHQEIRECYLELSGEDLQKIQVGAKELHMGTVFKNSERSQTFWVKNNHRNHIFVKLDIDANNMPDLQRTYPKSHVIAPGELQGFKITVYSSIVRSSVYPVTYTINYKHSFKLRVFAEIIMVKLELQNSLNKFAFRNDKLEKDKIDMCVVQKLKFFNGGNAQAEISWEENKEKAFKISPMKDIIPPQTEHDVSITFNPFDSPVQKEKYPDELRLNIVNGDQMKFPIEGIVSSCVVNFFELPEDTVIFDMVHTGVPSTLSFQLKNETNRVVTAYQIQNPLPEILQFKDQAGYLTDKPKMISITINHKEANPNFETDVPILIRGGKSLLLHVKANIVQPEVIIVEDKFDFGGVSYNEPSTKVLSFKNNSRLSANVIVNLNSDIRFKDFKLVLSEKDKNIFANNIKALEKEKKDDMFEEEEEIEESENNNDEEADEEKNSEDLREFSINIPPGQTLTFDLIFCPNSFDNDNLDFYTNFQLVGADNNYNGLKRQILAKKIDSAITISDMVVKFPKTFIYENQKNFRSKEIKIASVQPDKKLDWKLILPENWHTDAIFDVGSTSGVISPHQDGFVTLQFTFAPRAQKEYKTQITLKVTDEEGNQTTKIIKLEGEGLFPRLYFDKRELILPIVPLGIESVIAFKVKNEGYENEEINAEFETYPQGALPVKFNWLENTHAVGYNKSELKCEVRFSSNKPITFTTKLVFYDKAGQQYPIIVAGTTDNCIFTNYSYFQRTDKNSYEFYSDQNTHAINIRKITPSNKDNQENEKNNEKSKNEDDEDDEEKKSEKNSDENVSSMAKNSTALLGYNKINNQLIEMNCKHVKKYLKKVHLDEQFLQNNSFKLFPEDIVKDNGRVIYMLIKNLIGKEPPGKIAVLEQDLGKRALQIREQYCQLIRFLQECGASLNTVFPEYLMDFNMYKKYISLDENRIKVLDPKWDKSKTLPLQWRYYHKESWVLLVYQILKIFYLSRVNNRSFSQAIKHLPADVQQRYLNTKIPNSNVYSQSEYILLRWVNACFETVNPHSQRDAITFSKDFSDSALLSGVVLSYFPREEKNIVKRKGQPTTDIKILNYGMILNILKEYGIYTHIKTFHISPSSAANAREMVLFLTMLFQNFQHFYPKETIQFSCVLGDTIVKSISLMNPTNKPLEYAIKHEGDDCFIYPNITDIRIDPNKESEYQITFKSKFSAKVEGKIYFINRRPGWNSQAAPIVYNLASNITGRRSLEYKIISTNIYSQFAYKFQAKLPFPKEKGEFEVHLEQRKKIVQQKKKVGRPLNNNKQASSELLYKVFTLKNEEDGTAFVKFNQDGIAEVTIFYLPVELDIYECNVIFLKENVGEFQYTIEGRVEKPFPKKAETIEETCNVDEMKEFFLEINLENSYLKNAVDQLRPIPGAMINGKQATMNQIAQKLLPSPDRMRFAVESTKSFYAVPATLFPGSIPEPPNQENKKKKTGVMYLKVKFTSKVCMVYEGDIILTNLEKPNDIRIYKLFVDVKPKEIRATLEFFCPLKETITQKIPIENKSDKDWIIKAEISGQTNGFFRVEQDKRIPKHNVTDIALTFNPTEKITVNGMLRLINNFTSEKYFYTLIGNVEDPLAEGNIEINNINAKEIQKKVIEIENGDKDEIYTVETDLDDVISGPASFSVKAYETYKYEMNVHPLLGKIYFGRIIFRDSHKGYKWFTVRIEAKCQIQAQTIEMRTEIRKGIYIDINLENPSNDSQVFMVDFDSDLFLFGEKEVKVEPKSSKVYKLLFAPLRVGVWENIMLHIYNDRIGEFLYKLKLISESQPIITSEVIKAELGKYTDYPIMLENPTMEEIEVKYTNNNKKLFQVLQEKIYLPSGVKKEILVRYTPSTLSGDEQCILKFESKKIGNWEFHLRGTGIPPTSMETTFVRTYVGGVTSGQINFKNPLNEKITVNIELKCEQFPDSFGLINKKTKYPLDSGRMLVIPFTFRPQVLAKYSADIYVYISKTLFWKYPIEGITEVKSKGIDYTFKTKSKKMFETKIYLDISNLPEKEVDFNDFVYILNIKEEKYKSLINKCLNIQFVDKKRMEPKDIQEKKLPLEIKFYPLRPFKTDIEFVLRKKTGGQWIYNIILEATEPDPDDIIHIKSSLGKQSFVAFKLQNIFTKDAKFIAYFSHDTSSEFSVSPREGILDQSGREGTQFVICYLPTEYGKVKTGKLIVETDEVEWIFEVRGTHLDYKPPDIKKGNLLKQTKASEGKNLVNDNKNK